MRARNALIFGSLLTTFTLGAGACFEFGLPALGFAFTMLAVATLFSAELWVQP